MTHFFDQNADKSGLLVSKINEVVIIGEYLQFMYNLHF